MAGTTASVRDPWEQQQSENADHELYVCTYIENKRYIHVYINKKNQIPWTIINIMNANVLTYATLYAAFRVRDLCCVLLILNVAVKDEKNNTSYTHYHNAVSHLKIHVIILNVR